MENDRNAASRRSLPPGLATKIADYRSRVRKRKLFEAGLVGGLGLLASYLVLFGLDRIDDFPKWLRAIVSFAGFATVAIALPLALWRWVLGTSTVANTARVLARKDDAAGDRVLSAVELTGDSREFDRSPELTAAAIRQVDEDLRDRDFTNALPETRRRGLLLAGALPLLACFAAFTVCPDAALSSLCRWACPFGEQARYAFAKTEPLADRLYVAKGERFGFTVKLAADARWRPERAEARFENGETFAVEAHDGRFVFEMPGRHKDEDLRIAIGDSKIVVRVLPLDRPEIAALDIDVALPDYLGIAGSKTVDGRSGGLVAVEGATITARARLTRAPARAAENDRDLAVSADGFTAAPRVLKKPEELRFTWSDTFGLDALQPFTLALRPHPDGAPTARLDGLINGAVLLSTDTTSFKVVATDDFGVRRVGIAWTGVADALDNPSPATGERVLAAAEKPDAGGFEAECAFHAPSLGIAAQALDLRPFVEDAFPGRARVYGTAVRVFLMTPEQHMIWLTAQLNAWRDEATELRDRESELFETNKALRRLSADELEQPRNRKKLESQAAAEKANGRRLNGLVTTGRDLLAQATRNSEFNSNTLDAWAETMRTLEGIAQNRMPSVADLLAKAARASGAAPAAPVAASENGSPPPPKAGESETSKLPNAPTVADVESTMAEQKPTDAAAAGKKSTPPPATLRMPQTLLAGKGAANPNPSGDDAAPPETLSQAELDKALEEQKKLLEEFAKVSGEIKDILKNLEGSTFVKRLKAESREQIKVAKAVYDFVRSSFGDVDALAAAKKATPPEPARRAEKSSASFGLIQDDLGAYVTRLEGDERQKAFKGVLDEMKKVGVTREVRGVAADVTAKLNGDAISGAEYWADTADRWAEQLVGPG